MAGDDNDKKFKIFLEIGKMLNDSFNITPVLYGSLGLYRLLNESKKANDIDFLVPRELIVGKWNKLIDLLRGLNFELKDVHEHEFIREGNIVAFGDESDLAKYAKIESDDIKISQIDGIKFKELDLEQYLSCYKMMLRDDYRQEKRGNADKEKIALIEASLKSRKN